jgi:FAD synthase
MNQQDHNSAVELLKTIIYDEKINQYTIKEKADIYKAKLMMEFMKKIRSDEIRSQLDYLLNQHHIQLSLSEQLFSKLS